MKKSYMTIHESMQTVSLGEEVNIASEYHDIAAKSSGLSMVDVVELSATVLECNLMCWKWEVAENMGIVGGGLVVLIGGESVGVFVTRGHEVLVPLPSVLPCPGRWTPEWGNAGTVRRLCSLRLRRHTPFHGRIRSDGNSVIRNPTLEERRST